MSIQANRIHSTFVQHRDRLEHGYTVVPNYFLDNFINKPFVGKDGKTHKISPTAGILYLTIRRYAYRHSSPEDNSYYESTPYPSVKTLADAIGVSERQCQRLLNELQSAGLITRASRPGFPNMLIIEPLPIQDSKSKQEFKTASSEEAVSAMMPTPDTQVTPRGDIDVTQRKHRTRKHQKKTHTPNDVRVREIVYALTLDTDGKHCARVKLALEKWGKPAVDEAFERVKQELARPGCRIVDPIAIMCKQAQTIAAASALGEERRARFEPVSDPNIAIAVKQAGQRLLAKEPAIDRSTAREKLCALLDPRYPASLRPRLREEIFAFTEHLPGFSSNQGILEGIKALFDGVRGIGEGGAVVCPSSC